MQNIMRFQYYLDSGLAKQCSKDPVASKAIFSRAIRRLEYVKTQNVDQDNASFVFEDVYEVIRECIQALMVRDGFKPYSHEAVVAFVNDHYHGAYEDKLINRFDRYRIIRNDSMYRAVVISEEETIKAIIIAEDFVKITRDIIG